MGGGSGGGGNTTTTTKADPWVGVQPYLSDAYSQLSNLYNKGQDPQFYPGQTTVTPDLMEKFGQRMQLNNITNWGDKIAALGANGLTSMNINANQAVATGTNALSQGMQGMQGVAAQAGGGAGGANTAMNQLMQQAGASAGGVNTANSAANQLLGYGNSGITQQGTAGATNAMNQLAAAGDPANNPYFQSAVQSAIRPVTQQFQEQVLPSIKSGAQQAGQFGGSRQGIAEGLASRGYMDTVGDITSNMGNAAYAQGLNALQSSGQMGQNLAGMGLGATGQAGQMGQGLAGLSSQQLASAGGIGTNLANLAGSLQTGTANLGANMFQTGQQGLGQQVALGPAAYQGIVAPGQTVQGIGQQLTADQQAQRDAEVQRWNYQQNLPYSMLSDYLQQLQGGAALGGTQTARSSGGSGSNRMTGALGGAATGAAIGSVVPGIGTAIGAGAGALYGLFM